MPGRSEEDLRCELKVEDVGSVEEVLDTAVVETPDHVVEPLVYFWRPESGPESLSVNDFPALFS